MIQHEIHTAQSMGKATDTGKLLGGYRKGELVIGVTHIPNRKRPALYVQKGYIIYPYAYFKDENEANRFMYELGELLGFGGDE